MTEPLIRVRNLRYRYPDGTQALDGVDFDLFPGECVAILGANGSGKSTFLMHLNGLLSGEGEITIDGLPVSKPNLPAIRQKIGFVFQDSDSQMFLPTVIEDVAFGPLNLGLSPERALEQASAALEQVGMMAARNKAPYHLSAGQKRRAAIAGVLAMSPSILALDEPTTFLDPPAQAVLRRLLGGLPQAKLLATHDMHFAAALSSRAVFFDQGRITREGTVQEVAGIEGW